MVRTLLFDKDLRGYSILSSFAFELLLNKFIICFLVHLLYIGIPGINSASPGLNQNSSTSLAINTTSSSSSFGIEILKYLSRLFKVLPAYNLSLDIIITGNLGILKAIFNSFIILFMFFLPGIKNIQALRYRTGTRYRVISSFSFYDRTIIPLFRSAAKRFFNFSLFFSLISRFHFTATNS